MENILTGKAHTFGDNINTDYIIAGKYTKTLDFTTLAEHVFEDIAPGFSQRVRPGDIVAAGRNFGCGSSREQRQVCLAGSGARQACPADRSTTPQRVPRVPRYPH